MVNLAEAPNSIRTVAKSLLDDAEDTAKSAGADAGDVVFRVAPTFYRPLPEQQALCTQLAIATTLRPLTYAERTFANVEDFDAWLMDFSQGQGADGRLLYQQCGGNCDPSFTFVIEHGAKEMKVATEVYCGYARDRKANMYTLSTTLRPACAPPADEAQVSDADPTPRREPHTLRE